MIAAKFGDVENVKILINESGIQDKKGRYAINYAINHNQRLCENILAPVEKRLAQ